GGRVGGGGGGGRGAVVRVVGGGGRGFGGGPRAQNPPRPVELCQTDGTESALSAFSCRLSASFHDRPPHQPRNHPRHRPHRRLLRARPPQIHHRHPHFRLGPRQSRQRRARSRRHSR